MNTTNLHNVACDVKMLQLLLNVLNIDNEIIKKSVKSIDQLSAENKSKISEANAKRSFKDYTATQKKKMSKPTDQTIYTLCF